MRVSTTVIWSNGMTPEAIGLKQRVPRAQLRDTLARLIGFLMPEKAAA